MTPLPDEQPLSRRQLREQQRTTEIPVPVEPPAARRVSTSAVAGGTVPDVTAEPAEPPLSAEDVAALEEAEAAGRPLTRRQARDLERVRTGTFGAIPPQQVDSEAQADSSADAATSVPETSEAFSDNPDIKKAAPKSKKAKRPQAAGGN